MSQNTFLHRLRRIFAILKIERCLVLKGFFIVYAQVLYLVSNCYYHAKSYLKLYKQRWNIEVFFRTIKQDFGLAHCQSRSFKIQQAHTRSIFIAYTFFKYHKILDHDESVSDLKQTSIVSSIASFCHNFGYYA